MDPSTSTNDSTVNVPATSGHAQFHEPLSSELRPTTDAVLTVRVIKSFEFRTQKSLVLKGINLEEMTVGELMERVRNGQSNFGSQQSPHLYPGTGGWMVGGPVRRCNDVPFIRSGSSKQSGARAREARSEG